VKKKRIFVLGGAGNMGSELTRGLTKFDELEEIMIGEFNREAADKLAKDLKDPRVKTCFVDVTDTRKTAEKVRGYDMMMNATYFGFFDAALAVACHAKVYYADLISEPTDAQAKQVREAGITMLSGLGLTPGLTNVLAKHGVDQFDQAEEIHIHWVSLRSVAPSPGLLGTIIWELSTVCPTRMYYLNGNFEVVPLLQGSKTVRFADPIGEQIVYFVPHTETVSLAKNIPGIKFVSVRGTWRPEYMEDFRVLNKYGLLDPVEVQTKNGKVLMSDVTRQRMWDFRGGKIDDQLWGFFLNVEVIGMKKGKRDRFVMNVSHPVEWKEHSTAKLTGIPAAVGAALLAIKGCKEKRIIYPEEYFNASEFVSVLGKKFPEIKVEVVKA
jgi:lysine 6-dehydrogenase